MPLYTTPCRIKGQASHRGVCVEVSQKHFRNQRLVPMPTGYKSLLLTAINVLGNYQGMRAPRWEYHSGAGFWNFGAVEMLNMVVRKCGTPAA